MCECAGAGGGEVGPRYDRNPYFIYVVLYYVHRTTTRWYRGTRYCRTCPLPAPPPVGVRKTRQFKASTVSGAAPRAIVIVAQARKILVAQPSRFYGEKNPKKKKPKSFTRPDTITTDTDTQSVAVIIVFFFFFYGLRCRNRQNYGWKAESRANAVRRYKVTVRKMSYFFCD